MSRGSPLLLFVGMYLLLVVVCVVLSGCRDSRSAPPGMTSNTFLIFKGRVDAYATAVGWTTVDWTSFDAAVASNAVPELESATQAALQEIVALEPTGWDLPPLTVGVMLAGRLIAQADPVYEGDARRILVATGNVKKNRRDHYVRYFAKCQQRSMSVCRTEALDLLQGWMVVDQLIRRSPVGSLQILLIAVDSVSHADPSSGLHVDALLRFAASLSGGSRKDREARIQAMAAAIVGTLGESSRHPSLPSHHVIN